MTGPGGGDPQPTPDRLFVLESAGSLATTHEVLDRIRRDLHRPDAAVSLASVDRLFGAALYVGGVSRQVAAEHRRALADVGVDGTAAFILGGQVQGEPSDILLVYPEGNDLRASNERPFLQIGESKYGKFMLEMAMEARVDLETAIMIALGSVTSTARANLSVGPPTTSASTSTTPWPWSSSASTSTRRCSTACRSPGSVTCWAVSPSCSPSPRSTSSGPCRCRSGAWADPVPGEVGALEGRPTAVPGRWVGRRRPPAWRAKTLSPSFSER